MLCLGFNFTASRISLSFLFGIGLGGRETNDQADDELTRKGFFQELSLVHRCTVKSEGFLCYGSLQIPVRDSI